MMYIIQCLSFMSFTQIVDRESMCCVGAMPLVFLYVCVRVSELGMITKMNGNIYE